MKKILAMIAAVLLFNTLPAFAAGTCTQTLTKISTGVSVLEFTCVGDAVDGLFPATVSTRNIKGYVFMIVTNPGAPALTNLYDITLTDTDGLDISGGLLGDRNQAVTELVVPKTDLVRNLYGRRYVKSKVTLEISNNSVASGRVVISVYIEQ